MPDISSANATDEVTVTLPVSSSSFRDYSVIDTEVNTLSYSSFETGAVYAMLIRSGVANLIRTDVQTVGDASVDTSIGGSILFASAAVYSAGGDIILTFGTRTFATNPVEALVVFVMPDGGATASDADQINISIPNAASSHWDYDILDAELNTLTYGALTVGHTYGVIVRAGGNGNLFLTSLGGSSAGGTLSNEDPEQITVDGDAAPGDSEQGARINHVQSITRASW